MGGILKNPAFWASLAALLAAIGIEVRQDLVTHIIEAVAAIAAIVGIIVGVSEQRKG